MKISEIELLWQEDSKINDIFIDKESLKSTELHFKYYKILNEESLALRKLEAELKILYKDKFEYFNGNIEEETLKHRNWLPLGEKLLKSNIPLYIESDKEYLRESYKTELQKQKIEFLKDIIKQINNRNFIIKNIIEWRKFSNGIN